MNAYSLLLTPNDDSGYTVTVPELPGYITEGETLAECEANAREAIALYCAVLSSGGVGATEEPAGVSGCGDPTTSDDATGSGPEREIQSNFGWTDLTYLPQSRRTVPPDISAVLQGRLALIDDLRILLNPDDSGYLAPEFWSARRGFLVRAFPFRDALAEEFPSSAEALLGIGDAASPLVEIELGQELYVWRQANEVLIVAGDPEAEPGSFRVAVRVPEAVFATEWWKLCSVARRYVAAETSGPVWLRHVDDDGGDSDGRSSPESDLSG